MNRFIKEKQKEEKKAVRTKASNKINSALLGDDRSLNVIKTLNYSVFTKFVDLEKILAVYLHVYINI